jgi:RHS repeat-associated protein
VHGPGIDEPLAADGGSELSYLHADGLGSVVRVTNAAGAVTLTRQYDAWGVLQAGADQPGYAYTGREWDPETGLYYYRARYYDPKGGRFLSDDPIGLGGGLNLYAYVANNPVAFVDPFGLQHSPGGPWHPEPPYDAVSCSWADECPTLQWKISQLSMMITAHKNWDKKHNTNRHEEEIEDLIRAIENCKAIYEAKCTPKPPKCGEDCVKVLIAIGAIIWVCVTKTPPVWAF